MIKVEERRLLKYFMWKTLIHPVIKNLYQYKEKWFKNFMGKKSASMTWLQYKSHELLFPEVFDPIQKNFRCRTFSIIRYMIFHLQSNVLLNAKLLKIKSHILIILINHISIHTFRCKFKDIKILTYISFFFSRLIFNSFSLHLQYRLIKLFLADI